jgi:hypothetical protein
VQHREVDLLLPFAVALAVGCWMAKAKVQRQRIAVLARFLSAYRIEKNIETVTQGYLRALGEGDPARREQVLYLLRANEQELCRQMGQLTDDIAAADPAATRVSKLPIWLPFALTLAPSFDLREALRIHARGICRAIDAEAATRAYHRGERVSIWRGYDRRTDAGGWLPRPILRRPTCDSW